MAPSQTQQDTVSAYFAEAAAPTIMGTASGSALIITTVNNAGLVLEQIGKSQRLLIQSRLVEPDAGFYQYTENLNQAFDAVRRDSAELQRILQQLGQHCAVIDAANAQAKSYASGSLGYTL